jgi:hypothetical protein
VYTLFVVRAYGEFIDRGHLAEDEIILGTGGGKIARIFHRDSAYLSLWKKMAEKFMHTIDTVCISSRFNRLQTIDTACISAL